MAIMQKVMKQTTLPTKGGGTTEPLPFVHILDLAADGLVLPCVSHTYTLTGSVGDWLTVISPVVGVLVLQLLYSVSPTNALQTAKYIKSIFFNYLRAVQSA